MDLRFRTVFVLFELEGVACTEISEMLQLPVGTVYSRLRKARGTFDKALRRRRPQSPAVLLQEGI